MAEVKSYCEYCHRDTWQALPGYVCAECHKSSSSSAGDAGAFGCGFIAAVVFLVVAFGAMLAINSLTLIPALLTRPWGLVGSLVLVRWLWKRDNLRAEPLLLRYGVSAFLVLWMGLFIIALTSSIFSLHLLSIAKEMLFITLPGVAFGFLATMLVPRFHGKLWPVFVAICLAHTIGKVTILGWIMNSF